MDQGDSMKKPNAFGTIVRKEKLWIITACSFLTDKAADWAMRIVEKMETANPPFTTYDKFVKVFRTCFKTVDKAGNVLTALEQLWQGTKTV